MLDNLIYLLQAEPGLLIFLCGLFGLFIGSFLNVVIYRLPVMMQHSWRQQCQELLEQDVESHDRFNLATPGSRCPKCGHKISALENIPVISFLLQKGRCKHCGVKISLRYPAIELLALATPAPPIEVALKPIGLKSSAKAGRAASSAAAAIDTLNFIVYSLYTFYP